MTPELKTRWLAALRSGEYSQVRGTLKNRDGYCCLGVLCEIAGNNLEEFITIESNKITLTDHEADAEEAETSSDELIIRVKHKLGIPESIVEAAMGKNDALGEYETTFPQIADWLEFESF